MLVILFITLQLFLTKLKECESPVSALSALRSLVWISAAVHNQWEARIHAGWWMISWSVRRRRFCSALQVFALMFKVWAEVKTVFKSVYSSPIYFITANMFTDIDSQLLFAPFADTMRSSGVKTNLLVSVSLQDQVAFVLIHPLYLTVFTQEEFQLWLNIIRDTRETFFGDQNSAYISVLKIRFLASQLKLQMSCLHFPTSGQRVHIVFFSGQYGLLVIKRPQ